MKFFRKSLNFAAAKLCYHLWKGCILLVLSEIVNSYIYVKYDTITK